MSGAERTARKRRQQAVGARKVAQAKSSGPDRRVIAGVVAVILLAVVVIGGVLLTKSSGTDTSPSAIPPVQVQLAPGVAEQRDGGFVVSGKPEAKTTIDLYADFLCPACGSLQAAYGKQIEEKINAGELKVNYHMIPLLNDRSNPPGYSLESANAALCAADNGKFTAFHDSLYAKQPEEGERGYDKNQLTQLGQALGITNPTFAACVSGDTYSQAISDDFKKAIGGAGSFKTPTILMNGTELNPGDPDWLAKAIASNQR